MFSGRTRFHHRGNGETQSKEITTKGTKEPMKKRENKKEKRNGIEVKTKISLKTQSLANNRVLQVISISE